MPTWGSDVDAHQNQDDRDRRAKALLGTQTLRETVDRSFDEVLAHDARRRDIDRMQHMEGLDLDRPAVIERAWR